jgi:MarR family transcriptional regulator, transcriptional regulator for hemolysin
MSATTAGTTAPECLTSDLCWLLSRANQLLSAEFDVALETSGLSPRKHHVLTVAQSAEHTQTELARIVGLDKTTMMVTLDELERDGLAERRPLPSDRRARIVAVTPAGRRRLRSADAALQQARERALQVLPEADRAAFLRSLGQLACSESAAARSAC